MDLLKNVEVLLMLAFGALCAAAWSGQAPAHAPAATQAAQSRPPTAVVVVTAKRLSAAEKRAFDAQARS